MTGEEVVSLIIHLAAISDSQKKKKKSQDFQISGSLLGIKKKKNSPSEKTKQMATVPCYQSHLYCTQSPGLWREGCHDDKHLRRVLEKLMNLSMSSCFPIFPNTHEKPTSTAIQTNDSIASGREYSHSIQTCDFTLMLQSP